MAQMNNALPALLLTGPSCTGPGCAEPVAYSCDLPLA